MLSNSFKSKQTKTFLRFPKAFTLYRFAHKIRSEKDYYDVLGVSRKASTTDIKEAFFRKSKELHPDNSNSENATAQFVELKQAYDVLRRPRDRLVYDNRGRKDYHNMYKNDYSRSYSYGGQYDFNDDWRRFWRDTERSDFNNSKARHKSEQQWKIILKWTALGTLLVILYNLGYVWQIYYRNYQLSKLQDEDEITKSFLRQSEFRDQVFDDNDRHSLARMLKADVDEAWKRRQEEFRGRNANEIREEYRWLKAVQDSEHMRRIKARRAELHRREVELRWGRQPEIPPKID